MPHATAPRPDVTAGWGFWLWWMLAGTVGWAGGAWAPSISSMSWDTIEAQYTGLAVGGIVVGLLQWLVLRRRITRAGWWVAANAGAVAAVGVVVFRLGILEVMGWVLGAASFGTVLGALQWLVLRSQVAGAGWWILASTVAWLAGMLGEDMGLGATRWVVLGTVYGGISGGWLVWLMGRPTPENQTPSNPPDSATSPAVMP